MCGVVGIYGWFGVGDRAYIGVQNGALVPKVRMNADTSVRPASYPPPDMEYSCEFFSNMPGLPGGFASFDFESQLDTDDSDFMATKRRNDPSVNDFSVSPAAEEAVLWRGFDGEMSFGGVTGGIQLSAQTFVEVGAFNDAHAACSRVDVRNNISCFALNGDYSHRTVSRTLNLDWLTTGAQQGSDMTSYSYSFRFPGRTWNLHPTANEKGAPGTASHGDPWTNGQFIGARTDEYWCVIAGISGGGRPISTLAPGSMEIELIEGDNGGVPEYQVRIEPVQIQGRTGVHVECYAQDQILP